MKIIGSVNTIDLLSLEQYLINKYDVQALEQLDEVRFELCERGIR